MEGLQIVTYHKMLEHYGSPKAIAEAYCNGQLSNEELMVLQPAAMEQYRLTRAIERLADELHRFNDREEGYR